MKYASVLFFAVLFSLVLSGVVSAEPKLNVTQTVLNDVIVAELDRPAVYDLEIVNNGPRDFFKIYTLVGVVIEPREEIEIPAGGTVSLQVSAYPGDYIKETKRGPISFEYQIKGRDTGVFKDKFFIKIIDLQDAFLVEAEPIHPDDSVAFVKIRNLEDTSFDDLSVVFDSVFFRESRTFSLGSYEEVSFEVELSKDGVDELVAGQYLVSATVVAEDAEANVEGVVDYLEKSGVAVEESTEGFVVRKVISKKINRGNTQVVADIEIERGIIGRLFTTFSIEPMSVDRNGSVVVYSWQESLSPGETLEVVATTNYTLPFVLIVAIVLVGLLVGHYSRRAVVLEKTVSLVRTKGGEFALKVRLQVNAKKNVDNLELIDSLPSMVKLYNKFGKQPDKIDKATRRLFWNIGNLTKGSVRVYSYIIYSKLNVVGEFGLPSAQAVFEKDGVPRDAWSNRAFYAAEKE